MFRRVIALALLTAACGNSSTEPPDVLDPPPPVGGQQLASDSYTIQPGEEKYFCYTFRSPADGQRAITEVQPIEGITVHHVVLFRPFPTDPEPDGFFECPVLVKQTWEPIWAGGIGAASLTLPEGVGFVVEPDTQYLVQFHLLNTGDTPVTERSGVNLRYADDASAITPAGIFGLGTFSLTIPDGAVGYTKSISCSPDHELHIFAVFPHMHKLGKSEVLETGPSEAEATVAYQIDPWVFGDQPMDPVDITIQPGEFMRSTCTWDNMTGHDVSYGESTDDEMCFFVAFYYPFTGIDGCIQ